MIRNSTTDSHITRRTNSYMNASLRKRAAGVLLHPTSLPGPHGIGTLGDEAYRFVDYLVRGRQTYWQVLPLGPTGYGDSPYSSSCSMAGNPLLIDLQRLFDVGDLHGAELSDIPAFPETEVDFDAVNGWKLPVLKHAAKRFLDEADEERRRDYETFCERHANWLDDYALFMALKEHFEDKAASGGVADSRWNHYWDEDIALRRDKAVARWRKECADAIAVQKVWQYYFFDQWKALRRYANDNGILIVGDMPFYVAGDSVDVWVARHLFRLDERGREIVVAGVPPDYFSKTGQLWGNPIYDWEAMKAGGFAWWIERFRALLELVDIIRVDHFRGFAASWTVPASHKTAVKGEWVDTPGTDLFETLRDSLGQLPILAEDLGLITEDVEELRDRFGFPGMRVLQFGFEEIGPKNPHVPYNHVPNSFVYPGTHDNDTTTGWFEKLRVDQKAQMSRYLNFEVNDPAWNLIRVTMASVGCGAVVPMQDVLALGSEARMNLPGSAEGNWRWRMKGDYADRGGAEGLADLVGLYGRVPAEPSEQNDSTE
jgi:4-alpha-glucanotransferase